MIRGMFLKIVLWFWASLVLVALALHAAVIATSIPTEVRVQRFSDAALAGYGRRAVVEATGQTRGTAEPEFGSCVARPVAARVPSRGRERRGIEFLRPAAHRVAMEF